MITKTSPVSPIVIVCVGTRGGCWMPTTLVRTAFNAADATGLHKAGAGTDLAGNLTRRLKQASTRIGSDRPANESCRPRPGDGGELLNPERKNSHFTTTITVGRLDMGGWSDDMLTNVRNVALVA